MSGKVAIVGMMASGKTTIGRELARVLAAPYVDSDHEMTAAVGMSIPEYFHRHGEAAFRRLEHETIAGLLERPGAMVLSLGGGAYMQPAVRELLRGRARTVFLKVTPQELIRRLERTPIAGRPLLASASDWRVRVNELLVQREPVYGRADLVFEASRHDVAALARELSSLLAAPGGHATGAKHD